MTRHQRYQPGERVYVPDEHLWGIVVSDHGWLGDRDFGVDVKLSDGITVQAAHAQVERVNP